MQPDQVTRLIQEDGRRPVRRTLSGLVCALVLACLAAAPAAQALGGARSMNNMGCKIDKLVTTHGYDLRGIVWSATGGSGSYRLFVKKEGPNGRSSTMQEGLFALDGSEEKLLGTISMNSIGGDTITATLVITSDRGDICTAEL
jgi:hypothetical protein